MLSKMSNFFQSIQLTTMTNDNQMFESIYMSRDEFRDTLIRYVRKWKDLGERYAKYLNLDYKTWRMGMLNVGRVEYLCSMYQEMWYRGNILLNQLYRYSPSTAAHEDSCPLMLYPSLEEQVIRIVYTLTYDDDIPKDEFGMDYEMDSDKIDDMSDKLRYTPTQPDDAEYVSEHEEFDEESE